MIAAALGARVIAVDISNIALAKATQLCAEVTINPDENNVLERMADVTGEGADVAIDALGSQITSSHSILSLRRRGRHIQLGLLLTSDGSTPEPMARIIAYESDILGSHGMVASDYPHMLEMTESGTLHPNLLVERTVGLADGIAALHSLGDSHSAPFSGVTIIDPSCIEP